MLTSSGQAKLLAVLFIGGLLFLLLAIGVVGSLLWWRWPADEVTHLPEKTTAEIEVSLGPVNTPSPVPTLTQTAEPSPTTTSDPVSTQGDKLSIIPNPASHVPTPTVDKGVIAFLSDRDHRDKEPVNQFRPMELYVMNPDASAQRPITAGREFCYASGGSTLTWLANNLEVAIFCAGTPDVIAVDTASQRQLIEPDGFKLLHCQWSVTGQQAACINHSDGMESLVLLNNRGEIIRQVTDFDNAHPWKVDLSPKGDKVVFSAWMNDQNEGGLYVINIDGSGLTHLTKAVYPENVAWSPDGSLIAFDNLLEPGSDIWVINADGSNLTNLTASPGVVDTHPAWSPDSQSIAYSQGFGSSAQVFVMKADGTENIQLTFDGNNCCPTWSKPVTVADIILPAEAASSPSGESRLAYTSDSNIIISKPDGSEPFNLTPDVSSALDPHWSPDGSQLIFAGSADDDPYGEIYVINADGGGLTRLTYDQAIDWDPVWSPDGTRIAFETTRNTSGNPAACNANCNWDVYVMNVDGSNATRLTDSPEDESSPTWSPDSTQIVFEATINRRDADIFVMNIDGSHKKNLTNHPAGDMFPAWSPDGAYIAFASNRDGNMDIFVMNTDGSGVVNLTNHPAQDQYPTWSADSSQIAFVSTRDGNMEIYTMNTDGGNVTRVTFDEGQDTDPAWSP